MSHGNVQKTAVASPVLLPGQIRCPLCKISCNDKNVLMGHVSAEHPAYKFMRDELNCFKVYISKSGLFKHKKTHVPEETDDSVLYMDCQQTFKSEQDCDNHNCPAHAEEQKKMMSSIQSLKLKLQKMGTLPQMETKEQEAESRRNKYENISILGLYNISTFCIVHS